MEPIRGEVSPDLGLLSCCWLPYIYDRIYIYISYPIHIIYIPYLSIFFHTNHMIYSIHMYPIPIRVPLVGGRTSCGSHITVFNPDR